MSSITSEPTPRVCLSKKAKRFHLDDAMVRTNDAGVGVDVDLDVLAAVVAVASRCGFRVAKVFRSGSDLWRGTLASCRGSSQ